MTISLEEHVARAIDDERRLKESACCSDGTCLLPGKCAAKHIVVSKATLRVAASIRESERAACEAIARAHIERGITTEADERAEQIADAIAALKGNGEGK
jgi:hypothetical protein